MREAEENVSVRHIYPDDFSNTKNAPSLPIDTEKILSIIETELGETFSNLKVSRIWIKGGTIYSSIEPLLYENSCKV